jgi:hypothetical protein
MKTLVKTLPLVLCAATSVTTAFADDTAACLDASTKAQTLRDAHQLVEARAQLRACAASSCPAVVQRDCANWLVEVDKSLPTVVVTAKNRAGADLVEVKVSVDERSFVSKLDGAAVPMNPGPHTFHFEGADGTRVDQQVVIKEGEKNQPVAVVLGAAVPPPPPAPTSTGATEPVGSSSPWRTVGWALGGVGVAGVAMGAVFGVIAIGDKNGAHCVDNRCDPGTSSGIKTAALLSDVGWIAGGVLLASGAAIVLVTPGVHERAVSLRVAPALVADGAGAVLGGAW